MIIVVYLGMIPIRKKHTFVINGSKDCQKKMLESVLTKFVKLGSAELVRYSIFLLSPVDTKRILKKPTHATKNPGKRIILMRSTSLKIMSVVLVVLRSIVSCVKPVPSIGLMNRQSSVPVGLLMRKKLWRNILRNTRFLCSPVNLLNSYNKSLALKVPKGMYKFE